MSRKTSSTVLIDTKVLLSFVPRKTFDYHQGASITSLDFDDSGQYLISAGIDKSIQLYDVHKGIHYKDIQSQKYGAHLARFTHKDLNCLYVSTPEVQSTDIDHAIRYLSLSDKKYIRYFKGHKAQVVSLQVDPVHETFITGSYDQTVKLWDLRSPNPQGSLDVAEPSLVAYDPHGIVFVVAKFEAQQLEFYDTKSFQNGPFMKTSIHTDDCTWTGIEFANNGKYLLLSTDGSEHYVVDAFLGQVLTALLVRSKEPQQLKSKYPLTQTACFSPCGKYVAVGSPQPLILLFDLGNLKTSEGVHAIKETNNARKLLPFKTLNTNQGLPKIIAFNPKLLTLATADNSVTLWQPHQ